MHSNSRFIFFSALFLGLQFIATVLTQFTLPNQPIKEALYLHNMSISNLTLRDCSFRDSNDPQLCPDVDIQYILYSSMNKSEIVRFDQSDWLRQSQWDPIREDIFLIHGYAGGDGNLPMAVLRDAYIKNGSFNVWVVDWGRLGRPPCYRAAVNNIKAVARCTGELISSFRTDGMQTDKVTCIGHSLGAHTCGLISRFVQFRLHRIVALDPARPLISNAVRLTSADAMAVHVIHTNAGHYGEGGRGGHVDFCLNGGRVQPFCENIGFDEQLCSHVWAVCYMAASLHPQLAKRAEPCSRRCPSGPRPGHRIGIPILMGQFTPLTASGSYCIQGDTYPPYCPAEMGDIGDTRCCLKAPNIKDPSKQKVRKKLIKKILLH